MKKIIFIIVIINIFNYSIFCKQNKVNFSIKMEGFYTKITDECSLDQWEEKFTYKGSLNAKLYLVYGFSVNYGLYEKISLHIGYNYGKKRIYNSFEFQIPNPWFYNKQKNYKQENEPIDYRTHIIDLGVRYTFLENRKMSFYLQGGISYFIVKFSTFDNCEFIWEYPEKFTVNNFVCKKYSPKTIGINIGTGVIYNISKLIDFGFGLNYRYGKIKQTVRKDSFMENVLKFNAGNFCPFLCLIIKI